MATAYLRTPTFKAPLTLTNSSKTHHRNNSLSIVSLTAKRRFQQNATGGYFSLSPNSFASSSTSKLSNRRSLSIFPFASYEETVETTDEKAEEVVEQEIKDEVDGAAVVEDSSSEGESSNTEELIAEEPVSIIVESLRSYREALSNNDEEKAAEIEAFLMSIEEEKVKLETKLATTSEELSYERDRVLRISADFDNFRKRTERERLSLVTNAKGEVVESLLPVIDNFERAKSQIKIENEGEEKINNSYQSISKQFAEILGSLGVVPVEPTGTPFDPLLHEAIMREESVEFEEGIVIEEYRKGFKLGDRLLRPSMVKVSAGPGPAKPESPEPSEVREADNEAIEEGKTEAESPKDE